MKHSFTATLLGLVALVGCIKQPDANVNSLAAPESKPIVTILEQHVTEDMMTAAAKQFYCDDDTSKKQFIESGVRIGWSDAERIYNGEKTNKNLDVWFSETRDSMLQGGTHGAGEQIPNSVGTKNNLPENRCLVLGRTTAYAWFFYAIQAQSGLARCTLPAERVGAYSALLFYRMQSLQLSSDGAHTKFALVLPEPPSNRAPPCADDYRTSCSKAFNDRLTSLDSQVLKPKDGSQPVSKPQMFAEVYCH